MNTEKRVGGTDLRFEQLATQVARGIDLSIQEQQEFYELVTAIVRRVFRENPQRQMCDSEGILCDLVSYLWIQKGPTYDPTRGSASGYFYKVAGSEFRQRVQVEHARNRLRHELPMSDDRMIDESVAPQTTQLIDAEELSILAACIEQLPYLDRYVVRERHNGKSYQDLSNQLGMSPECLRKRYYNAKNRIIMCVQHQYIQSLS